MTVCWEDVRVALREVRPSAMREVAIEVPKVKASYPGSPRQSEDLMKIMQYLLLFLLVLFLWGRRVILLFYVLFYTRSRGKFLHELWHIRYQKCWWRIILHWFMSRCCGLTWVGKRR